VIPFSATTGGGGGWCWCKMTQSHCRSCADPEFPDNNPSKHANSLQWARQRQGRRLTQNSRSRHQLPRSTSRKMMSPMSGERFFSDPVAALDESSTNPERCPCADLENPLTECDKLQGQAHLQHWLCRRKYQADRLLLREKGLEALQSRDGEISAMLEGPGKRRENRHQGRMSLYNLVTTLPRLLNSVMIPSSTQFPP
jgi:hypothetical protein